MSLIKSCVITKKCIVDKDCKKKKIRKPSGSLLKRIKELGKRFKLLRLFVLRRIAIIRRRVNLLTTQVNSLQEQVTDLTFSTNAIRSFLLSRIGSTVTVETIAGAVTGQVVLVGDDFVQILEPSGANVLIPLVNINAVI